MRYIIFTLPSCCRCPAVKNYLLSSGLSGQIIDASTESGLDQARYFGISSTPTVIFTDESGMEIGASHDLAGTKKFIEEHK